MTGGEVSARRLEEEHVMRPLKNLGAVIVAACCLLLIAAPVVRPQDKTKPRDKLKELLKERLAAAEKVHDLTVKGYTQGDAKFTIDHVHAAKTKLLDARLDLAETKQQRIQVHKDAVKEAADWEQAGAGSQVDHLKARLYRLEREIALAAFVAPKTEVFDAIVARFKASTIAFRKLGTDEDRPKMTGLAVAADCKFVKVKFDLEKNKVEPAGEFTGGKDAFANLVQETVETEKRETAAKNFKAGLGGVVCQIVTEGDSPPMVVEIRVFADAKK
jgi:Outer membrane efflux protein